MLFAFVVIWLVGMIFFYQLGKKCRFNPLLLVAAYLIPRLLSTKSLPIILYWDFQQYYQLAVNLSAGDYVLSQVNDGSLIYLLPFKAGYSFLLSQYMNIFGSSLFSAQMFNMLLEILMVLAIYIAGSVWINRKTGYLSGLWMALMPSYILYASITGSEQGYSLFFVLMMFFAWAYQRKPSWKYVVLVGASAVGAYLFRPTITLGFIVTGLWMTFTVKSLSWKNRIVKLTGLVFVYFVLLWVAAWQIEDYTGFDIRHSSLALSLAHGSTYETDGGTNAQAYLQVRPYFAQPEKADELCWEIVKENCRSHWKLLPILMVKKIIKMWLVEDFGTLTLYCLDTDNPGVWVQWFLMNYWAIFVLSNLIYYLVIGLSIKTFLQKSNLKLEYQLIIWIYLVYGFAHLFLEASSRYHYSMTPLLFIPASAAVLELLPYIHTKTRPMLAWILRKS